jgi:hypothetical protein
MLLWDGRPREQWRAGYAWLPVRVDDGSVVWLEHYEWRYRFGGVLDSYFQPELSYNAKLRRRCR